MGHLLYVAPKESMDSILKNGIFPPTKVMDLISKNELPEEVLGVISSGHYQSFFPDYVSLLQSSRNIKFIAERICQSHLGQFNHPDFMAMGYVIDRIISKDDKFITADIVKEMNSDCFPGEVLYKGIIKPEHIIHKFAVRTWD